MKKHARRFLLGLLLPALPFVGAMLVYWLASNWRLAQNPDDRILPPFGRMWATIISYAFPNAEDESILARDTLASIGRVFLGTSLSATVGLIVGLQLGLSKVFRRVFGGFVTIIAMIPPIAILPILFMLIGVGESAIIGLIFAGTVLQITRDVELAVLGVPKELLTKAQTLGASGSEVLWSVVLPLTVPRLLDSIRVGLGAAWIFVIVAESIIGEIGLGYRIFLVRRYMAMDVIIPYVVWIGILGMMMDAGLRLVIRWRYRWYAGGSRAGA